MMKVTACRQILCRRSPPTEQNALYLSTRTQGAALSPYSTKTLAMADDNKAAKKQQLNIELPEDIAEGVYSNLAIIGHSQSEFVVDFVRIIPNAPKAKVKSRIVLTPQHAKRLTKALIDNIKKYEAQHGKIAEANQPEQQFPLNFTPTAQA